MTPAAYLLNADARAIPLRSGSVQCVVTSPPYWGLRDYGLDPMIWGGEPAHAHEWGAERQVKAGHHEGWKWTDGGFHGDPATKRNASASLGAFCPCGAWRGVLGLEPTPDLYVSHLVAVFREVRRVLRDDGTVWCNLGDAYCASQGLNVDGSPRMPTVPTKVNASPAPIRYGEMERGRSERLSGGGIRPVRGNVLGLKPKDLVGIPWRVAFALQADGWYLRSDIIWSKPNPMPESMNDRPTKAHEYVFLLTKRATYYYDAEAIKEPNLPQSIERASYPGRVHPRGWHTDAVPISGGKQESLAPLSPSGRNRRSVWTIATESYPEAHFATFPEKLVEPCILAGTSERGACPACGAPWGRKVQQATNIHPGASHAHTRDLEVGHAQTRADGKPAGTIMRERFQAGRDAETLGWFPPCACPQADPMTGRPVDPVPCRVLDPFAGSGTTVAVAERLGRVGVGVELKPEYVALARKRTVQAGLL